MRGERTVIVVAVVVAALLASGITWAQETAGPTSREAQDPGERQLQETVRRELVARQALRARAQRLITQAAGDRQAHRYDDALSKLSMAQNIVEFSEYRHELGDVAEQAREMAVAVSRERVRYQQRLDQKRRQEALRLAARRTAEATEQLRSAERATLGRAKELYDRRSYEEAARLARAVANVNPRSAEAYLLLEKAQQAASHDRLLNISERRAGEIRTVIEESLAATVPMGERETMVYPENWKELTRRRQVAAPVVGKPEEAGWRREIEDKLERQVSFDFIETPLNQIVEFLRTVSGINIVLDSRGIEAAGKDPAMPITLRVSRISLRDALDWITEFGNLKWTMRKGVVLISDATQLAQERYMTIYDVRDLLGSVPDFAGPTFDLEQQTGSGTGGGGGGFSFEDEEDEEDIETFIPTQMTGEELVQLIVDALGLQGEAY